MKSKPDNLYDQPATDTAPPWLVKFTTINRHPSTGSADTVRRMLARWIAQRIVVARKERRR
jgi:hypothetical protein